MKYSYLYGAEGSPVSYSLGAYRDKTRLVLAAFISCIVVFGMVTSQLIASRAPTVQASPQPVPKQPAAQVQSVVSQEPEPQPAPTQTAIVREQVRTIDLSGWFMSHGGSYSVSVYDQDGHQLAEAKANDHYFMASIYKLYVAYVGYQNIDKGIWADDANYINDWSRTKCLDEMIRTSNSPCGEKMMAEIGRTNIQDKLNEYGLENTSFKEFTTSSADVANVLIRLQKGVDLSPASKQKLMDSMAGQIYRDAMAKGFGDWAVYDKVGFRDQDEYHDVGIVVSPAGKTYVVSILTNKAGTSNIADLAQTIKASLR